MPLTADMRRQIDQIRDYLFGGGYPNPMANAEQLSFLFFFYLIEGIDAENAARAKVLRQKYASLFAGDWELKNPLNAQKKGDTTIPRERFRWSLWARGLSGEALVRFVQDEVFAFFEEIANQSATNFMRGARLSITEPTVLTQVVTLVDGLRLDQADSDTKGDLFEHVLKQIKQAGELGQFRTPRHIIRAIVEMIDPKVGESIYDPAAGTAGFLVAAYNHMRLANSSDSGIATVEIDGKTQRRGIGDKLSAAQITTLQAKTFYGNDVDPQMVRLATMNLTLRGLPNVRILLRNVLTSTLDAEQRERLQLPESYHVVLANPPFAGKIDNDRVVDDVKVGNSKATEVLFLKYMMESLRPGGRCGVIVPEGLLFSSTSAHKEIRRQLIENNRVEAVMSLPGGVFQPYSGVKTSVLLFRKGGSTDRVLFLHVDNDGYKLDANHDTPIEADDLPALVMDYRERDSRADEWAKRDDKEPWHAKWWFAGVEELRSNEFNLSAGRYRPVNASTAVHRDPRELLDELAELEREIATEVDALREALGAALEGSEVRWEERLTDRAGNSLPLGWKTVRLGEIASFQGGKNIQAGAVGDSKFRILKISAVTTGVYVESESKPAPRDFDPPPHYLVRKGDILFSRANTEELVGATALVEETDGCSLLPDKLWRLVWKDPTRIVPLYILAILQAKATRQRLSKIASGTGGSMKNISQAKLSQLTVPLPPREIQERFAQRAIAARSLVAAIGQARTIAEQTAQSLLSLVFEECV